MRAKTRFIDGHGIDWQAERDAALAEANKARSKAMQGRPYAPKGETRESGGSNDPQPSRTEDRSKFAGWAPTGPRSAAIAQRHVLEAAVGESRRARNRARRAAQRERRKSSATPRGTLWSELCTTWARRRLRRDAGGQAAPTSCDTDREPGLEPHSEPRPAGPKISRPGGHLATDSCEDN